MDDRRRNIGKRLDGPELDVELTLRGAIAAALINAAVERGLRPVVLLANIIEHVIADNLISAVVDG